MKMDDHSRTSIGSFGRPGKLSLDWLNGIIFFIERSTSNQVSACHVASRCCSVVAAAEEGAQISDLVYDPLSGYDGIFLYYYVCKTYSLANGTVRDALCKG